MTRTVDLQHTAEKIGRGAVLVSVFVTIIIGPGANASEESPLPIDEAGERAFLETLGGGFRITRSPRYFVLFHNIDDNNARDILHLMDRVHERVGRFCEAYDLPRTPLSRRLESLYSVEAGLFERLHLPKVDRFSGVYDPSSKRCYFDFSWPAELNALICGNAIAEAASLSVRHESAHQVFDHLCPRLSTNMPEWLAEGLACAFEAGAAADHAPFRRLNRLRGADVMLMLDADQRSGSGREVSSRAVQSKVSIVKMMFVSGVPDRNDPNDASTLERRSRWYASAWAVVFYLQNERPEGFRRLLHALNAPAFKKENLQQTIESTIGPIDEDFEKRVWGYLRRAYGEHVGDSGGRR